MNWSYMIRGDTSWHVAKLKWFDINHLCFGLFFSLLEMECQYKSRDRCLLIQIRQPLVAFLDVLHVMMASNLFENGWTKNGKICQVLCPMLPSIRRLFLLILKSCTNIGNHFMKNNNFTNKRTVVRLLITLKVARQQVFETRSRYSKTNFLNYY